MVTPEKRAYHAAWREKNREYVRDRAAAYYAEHREEIILKNSEYAQTRLLGPEGDRVRQMRTTRVSRWRRRDPEKHRQYLRASWARAKAEMIAAYGGHCACCGETASPFLSLDHVNRDGAEHRRQFGGRGTATARQVWSDLKRRGWPQDNYRLLCMNCNFATRFGDPCPHTQFLASLWAGLSEHQTTVKE